MKASTLNKLLRPLYRRIRLALRRGVLTGSNASAKMQTVQVQITSDLTLEMEHFEPYGFTSNPHNGAEPIVGNIEGKSHPVTLLIADRRFRVQSLKKGEVAIHDDQGQIIHFKQDGHIQVIANTQLTITAPLTRIEGDLDVTGEVVDRVDIDGQSMNDMRDIFNDHTHTGDSGGSTSVPNNTMGN
ncbi:MAG: phage baseplate assembly protein [Methylophaga sp.]|nr:phage baseplate assembly protein [Methylophaga sp.]